jgi:hypothetical protein
VNLPLECNSTVLMHQQIKIIDEVLRGNTIQHFTAAFVKLYDKLACFCQSEIFILVKY